MRRKMVIGIAMAVVALLFVVTILVIDGASNDVIADDVRIGTVDVGGLHGNEARSLVQRKLAGSVGDPVAVTYKNRRFVLRPADTQARLGDYPLAA